MDESLNIEAWASAELERLAPLINNPERSVAQRAVDVVDWCAACCVFGIDGSKLLRNDAPSIFAFPHQFGGSPATPPASLPAQPITASTGIKAEASLATDRPAVQRRVIRQRAKRRGVTHYFQRQLPEL